MTTTEYNTRLEAVSRALKIGRFSERRKALREIVGPLMKDWFEAREADGSGVNPSYITRMSGLVGEGAHQISPRPTITGIRDALCEEALVMIAGAVEVDRAINMMTLAIADPVSQGVKSEAAKCGYAFGQHRDWDDPALRAVRARANEVATELAKEREAATIARIASAHTGTKELADALANKGALETLAGISSTSSTAKSAPSGATSVTTSTKSKPESLPAAAMAAEAIATEAAAKIIRSMLTTDLFHAHNEARQTGKLNALKAIADILADDPKPGDGVILSNLRDYILEVGNVTDCCEDGDFSLLPGHLLIRMDKDRKRYALSMRPACDPDLVTLQTMIYAHDALVSLGVPMPGLWVSLAADEVIDGKLKLAELQGQFSSSAAHASVSEKGTITDELLVPERNDDAFLEIVYALREELDAPWLDCTPTAPPSSETEASGVPTLEAPAGSAAQLIDLALDQAGLPPIGDIIKQMNEGADALAAMSARAEAAEKASRGFDDVKAEASGEMPKGHVVTRKAGELFGITGKAKSEFEFDVPVWEWEGNNPYVPAVDENYVFKPAELLRVLYAVITNQRAYLHGHTGSGKTTLIEQVAAHMNWPFMRVNFDSEITRLDLIGRDVLKNEGGVTTSTFVDGILPQMMSGPFIGCFDELDFVRPDVAYVMQRALEGNGLMITEDEGRFVKPHSMFRMFATGNTVGQGDEFGLYQGARPQSMALLDRFTVWVNVEYMNKQQREKLIKKKAPALSKEQVSRISDYVQEHLAAFTQGKVLQPMSPRTFLALAQAISIFSGIIKDRQGAEREALALTLLDRASTQDRAVLNGIADRVFA